MNYTSKILNLLRQAEKNSGNLLHLTANENVLSKSCREAEKSILSSRYLLGDHKNLRSTCSAKKHGFVLNGFESIQCLLSLADFSAKKMFHAEFVDFRPLSGLNAVMFSILTLSSPGDIVWHIPKEFGGHFSTPSLLENLGRKSVEMPFDRTTNKLDLDKIKNIFGNIPPNVVLLDYANPIYPLPLAELRSIVGKNTVIIYDASHVLGLIAGGFFQEPFSEGADCIIGSTHKTFPGPQKGLLLFKSKITGERTAEIISNSLSSSQHTHHTLALCIALLEMECFAKSYTEAIIKNARSLAKYLCEYGFKLLVPHLQQCTHSIYFFLPGISAEKSVRRLCNNKIIAHCKYVYGNDYIRVGIQEITRKGMQDKEMQFIASQIYASITDNQNFLSEQLNTLISSFKNCHYTFDQIDTE